MEVFFRKDLKTLRKNNNCQLKPIQAVLNEKEFFLKWVVNS